MSHYKLTYWNARGLAEVSRLLFVISGTPFEDNRLPWEEDIQNNKHWIAAKSTVIFGKIPELQVDGVHIPQSKAIERFLAKRFGMFGSTDTEAALIDGFSETCRDIVLQYIGSKADANKLAKYWEEGLPNILEILDKNTEKNGHFVDIQFYFFMTTHFDDQDKVDKCLSKFENLSKIVNNVANNNNIKEYISKREKTSF